MNSASARGSIPRQGATGGPPGPSGSGHRWPPSPVGTACRGCRATQGAGSVMADVSASQRRLIRAPPPLFELGPFGAERRRRSLGQIKTTSSTFHDLRRSRCPQSTRHGRAYTGRSSPTRRPPRLRLGADAGQGPAVSRPPRRTGAEGSSKDAGVGPGDPAAAAARRPSRRPPPQDTVRPGDRLGVRHLPRYALRGAERGEAGAEEGD
jgi:hypothetical protein